MQLLGRPIIDTCSAKRQNAGNPHVSPTIDRVDHEIDFLQDRLQARRTRAVSLQDNELVDEGPPLVTNNAAVCVAGKAVALDFDRNPRVIVGVNGRRQNQR